MVRNTSLPARQTPHPRPAIRKLHNPRQTRPRRIPENRPLHVRRLHLPPLHPNLTFLVNQRLGNIHRVPVPLREPETDVDLMRGRRVPDPSHLRAVDLKAVLHVLDAEVEVDGSGPDPGRIARYPAFGEDDEFGVGGGGFGDEVAGLVDCRFEV